MARLYKTASGTYSESELVVAVWVNPNRKKGRSQARLLETLTTDNSSIPIAFPLETLQRIQSWMFCPVAHDPSDLDLWLVLENGATREKPLLVPLTIAKNALGWQDFHIPSEYTEK